MVASHLKHARSRVEELKQALLEKEVSVERYYREVRSWIARVRELEAK